MKESISRSTELDTALGLSSCKQPIPNIPDNLISGPKGFGQKTQLVVVVVMATQIILSTLWCQLLALPREPLGGNCFFSSHSILVRAYVPITILQSRAAGLS